MNQLILTVALGAILFNVKRVYLARTSEEFATAFANGVVFGIVAIVIGMAR